jgi:2'-5' RNA ligase
MDNARMYFIAVLAPANVNEQVLAWKHYMRDHYGCTVALRSPAHITLIPPFWMPSQLEQELANDLAAFAAEQANFAVKLKNFDAFKPKVIFVHVIPDHVLETLKISLEDFLLSKNKYPVKKESRPFHPHVTIANRDLRKKDFPVVFEHFSRIAYETEFPADGIALLKHDGGHWVVQQVLPVKHFS